MPAIITPEYKLYDDPMRFYNAMLNDIEKAENYIFLETYRFNNDSIGIKFRDALTKKSKQGVHIKVLMDSWGTSLPSGFFSELEQNGGEVRYFQKLKLFWDFFTKNHRRNHRKLLIIDDIISYIGSANLTDYSLNWRECMLRIRSDIAVLFKKAFLQHFEIYNKYVPEKLFTFNKLTHADSEIIRDVPSLTKQRIRKRYVELIKTSYKEVIIETPYFLPSFFVRKALSDAAKRGVVVKVIMPKHSDVGLIDVLRNRFLGTLAKNGVKLFFYIPHNLHAKLLMVDKEVFSIGSPNFDYRSFRFQHEIVIVGRDKNVVEQIDAHIAETLQYSEEFNYDRWQKRSGVQKFFEWMLLPFRHLL
ncbi:MAG: phosphatidylserine/phosphatidylglycerophosphate/cardiolipin synthase family protein [Bacteroidales bacterium]|nr:phosphatidylserine/phosphatidylglycerophosphate/cardiolipin synthase family protein [Bacteroidales bacterium]